VLFRSGVSVEVAAQGTAADAALVFGGDGTVHRYLPELHAHQVPALVVPAGSGNDFAHALGFRRREQALLAWRRFCTDRSNVRAIDLGCIQEESAREDGALRPSGAAPVPPSSHLFCCVGGAGLDSDANRRANRMPRWLRRRGGYLLAAALAILFKHPAHMRAFARGLEGEAQLDADEAAEMVVFANAPTYGDGLTIAPGARLDDGRLDIIYVRRAGRLRLLRVAHRVLDGRHIELPEVWFARSAELTLAAEPSRPVYADGEFCCQTPVRVTVLPRSLRVIVPG
jgi:diacylglycerol kinase (ATP)